MFLTEKGRRFRRICLPPIRHSSRAIEVERRCSAPASPDRLEACPPPRRQDGGRPWPAQGMNEASQATDSTEALTAALGRSDLARAVERLAGVPVLVLGDIMLDRFVYGTVERISPISEERRVGKEGVSTWRSRW